MKRLLLVLAVLIMCSSVVSAIPTTQAATMIGNNNASLQATGASSPAWFMWGMYSGKLYLKTPNDTTSGGLLNHTLAHSPLTGSTLYYYKACDQTGCGNELSFTTLVVTPVPTTTIGLRLQTFMESENFDITKIPEVGFKPYSWMMPTDPPGFALALITLLMMFTIFYGMFVRGRGIAVAMLVGGAILPFLFTGQMLGIPPDMFLVAQGVWYISLTAVVYVVFLKR